ncbi:hypothetical protein K2X33_10520 [bacterium]|nr:hypothetical protein [bacterium]
MQVLSSFILGLSLAVSANAALSPFSQRNAELTEILQSDAVAVKLNISLRNNGNGVVDKITATQQNNRGVSYRLVTGKLAFDATAVYGRLQQGIAGPQPFTVSVERGSQQLADGLTTATVTHKQRVAQFIAAMENPDIEGLISDPQYAGKATGRISSISYVGDSSESSRFLIVSGKCSFFTAVFQTASGDYDSNPEKDMDCGN